LASVLVLTLLRGAQELVVSDQSFQHRTLDH
jgi:hypothetical protein